MTDLDHTTEVQSLFVEHIVLLKRYVLSLLPNPSEAEDVVQEVFLTVTAKANDFQQGTNFKAWLLAIARFKVKEQARQDRRRANRLSEAVIDLIEADMSVEEVSPEDEEERMRALACCIDKLPKKQRTILELQYKERMKSGQIAEELGWKASAVYSILTKARANLRKCIEWNLRGVAAGEVQSS